MKIDYDDLSGCLDEVAKAIHRDNEFVRQVIRDEGQFFFGIVTPEKLRVTVSMQLNDED